MMRAEIAASTVDGNAVAGMLWDVFGADVTAAVGVCGGCGSAAPFAEAVVELDEAAAIVRCRSCTHTLFTVLREGGGTRLIVGMLHEIVRD
jgi:DNA-directed RNA polymerase subunit RPC12/RpoP